MTQRGVQTTTMTLGVLVAAVLIGGRISSVWHAEFASAAAAGVASTQHTPRAAARTPQPTKPPPRPKPSTPAPPKPSYTPRLTLAQMGVVRRTGSSAVALTFDDGPSPTWTPQLLDLLRAQHVRATFCLVGTEVHKYPALVARIVREGHTLCNHSWHHDLALGTRSVETIRADLTRTNAEIRRAAPGAPISYFRQPGGKWTPTVASVARSLGMTPLGWDVDPSDWAKPAASVIIQRVLNATRAGSIVLMHDGGGDRTNTLAACRTLLPQLIRRYRLAPLG
jgi:peptidoglycan/xylan/chitin deacetylase (PgdA/CDA1 family)